MYRDLYATETRRRIRKDGEHCLSVASCAAAEFDEHRREPEGQRMGAMVLGAFAETKVPRLPGRNPA